MPRPRSPERDIALQKYLESDGEIKTKELAEIVGVTEGRIRKWKSEDKWAEKLENKPKKKGGQKGNQNAAGKTPKKNGNKNAVTHGAYASVQMEDLTPEQQRQVRESMEHDIMGKMAEELESLMIRRTYLEGLLEQYESDDVQGNFYPDRIMHMMAPMTADDIADERDAGIETQLTDPDKQSNERMKTRVKTVFKSSAFDRAQKVQAELNKTHGRIIKQLDSMKSYELERCRLDLSERQLEFAKQRASGSIEIDVDDEAVEVDDSEAEQCGE